jgi:GNAT superfamily N-acetyltransferase
VFADGTAVVLRIGGRGDEPIVRALSARLFARFGDYRNTLPALIGLPGIHLVVAEIDASPVGFALLSEDEPERGVLDLTAIAVERGHQRRGVGAGLMQRTLERARDLARRRGTRPRVHLTVAESNTAARTLFERYDFVPVPAERGEYPGGQRSIGMIRDLDD